MIILVCWMYVGLWAIGIAANPADVDAVYANVDVQGFNIMVFVICVGFSTGYSALAIRVHDKYEVSSLPMYGRHDNRSCCEGYDLV